MTSSRIEDVAAKAGVSMKTVSRVLNDEPNVRPTMRARVMQAVAALDYRPNPSARGLAGKRSYLIGLIYGNISPSYLVNVQSGVLEVCENEHYGLVLHPALSRPDLLVEDIERFITQSRIDGLVMTPPLSDQCALMTMLKARHIDTVRISPLDTTSGAAVMIDEYQAAYEITAYLIGLGHRRLAFIKGPADHAASLRRAAAFEACLSAHNIAIDKSLIIEGDFTYASGVAAGQRLLALSPPPSAIFAGNDDMAAGVMHVAHDLGLKLPGQLSVAGFDDSPLASQIWPRLTTVHQPSRALGEAAATRLLKMIRERGKGGLALAPQLLDYELKIRDSTGPVRA